MQPEATAKYPEIEVQLTGQNGNVFNLIGIVTTALRKGKVSDEEIRKFQEECFSASSYDDALVIMMNWVEVY